MNHGYKAKTGSVECIHCNRDYIAHLDITSCEACGLSRRCDLFGDIRNPKTMLLCEECTRKEIAANDNVLSRTKILADAARIDDSITYNADFFNAKTVALIELKKVIDADTSLNEQEKKYAFQETIAQRYEKLKKVVFALDKKKEELVVEQLVIAKNLRSFGDSIRKDIRERIATADSNYAPPIKKLIKPVVKSVEKKSAMDVLIDKMMLMDSSIKTREEALEHIRSYAKAKE